MHIAHSAYTAQRETTSRFEASKKELPLKTKTTTTHRTEAIKKMLSEGGPESVLASKGRYSHTRTFAAGRDQRAILAFSPENKRVDGFVMNKDQQLVPIKPYDLPKELQQILNSDAFEAFLKDVHARLIQLHNGDFRLDIHQGLKGGVYSAVGDMDAIRAGLEREHGDNWVECTFIVKNQCSFPVLLKNYSLWGASFYPNHPKSAFLDDNDLNLSTMPPQAAGGFFAYRSGLPSHTTPDNKLRGIFSFLVDDCTVICGFCANSNGGTANHADRTIYSMNARIQIKAETGIINGTETPFNIGEFFNHSEYTIPGNERKYFFENTPETRRGSKIVVSYEYVCPTANRADFIFRFGELNAPVIPREIPFNNDNTLAPAVQNQQNRDINEIARQLAATIDAMQNMLNTIRQTP